MGASHVLVFQSLPCTAALCTLLDIYSAAAAHDADQLVLQAVDPNDKVELCRPLLLLTTHIAYYEACGGLHCLLGAAQRLLPYCRQTPGCTAATSAL
jgi:hypothetical protein